jgi:hypothetical protein
LEDLFGCLRGFSSAYYWHPTLRMESDPSIACPLKVAPVSRAELSPHRMPVCCEWIVEDKWTLRVRRLAGESAQVGRGGAHGKR